VSVGTLMDGMLKNVMVLDTLIMIFFKPIYICLKEVGNSKYHNGLSNNYPFLCHFNDVLDNYNKYGVNLDSQHCCGGLFAYDMHPNSLE